jgi:hypothetical protein
MPMEQVTIWYLTDNDAGGEIALSIRELGLRLSLIIDDDFRNANIAPEAKNIFIIDLMNRDLSEIISMVGGDRRIQGFLKFVILYKRQIKRATKMSVNLLHIEYISRPLNKNEFILLLEKSIIVERYREIMSAISREAENRIEAYENLMNITRKEIFESERGKGDFVKILEFERNLKEEQERLNSAIDRFTLLRQKEMFHLKSGVHVEEMLSDLRKNELHDEEENIDVRGDIDYSTGELIDPGERIGSNRDEVIELDRDRKRDRKKKK